MMKIKVKPIEWPTEIRPRVVKKINGHEVKFTSYPDNRVVIAEIRGCSDDVFHWLGTKCGLEYPLFTSIKSPNYLISVFMPNSLKAVAKCHPEDEFDQRAGEDIAYKKLQKKYWEKYSDRAQKLYEVLASVQSSLSEEIQKSTTKAESIQPISYFGS